MKNPLIAVLALTILGTVHKPTTARSALASTAVAYQPFTLNSGQAVASGDLTFVYQTDGNLCLYQGQGQSRRLLWCALSTTHAAGFANFQADGNLVLYANGAAYWASGSSSRGQVPTLSISDFEPYVSIHAGYTSNDPSINTDVGPQVLWSSSQWKSVNNPDPFGLTQHWLSTTFFSFYYPDVNSNIDTVERNAQAQYNNAPDKSMPPAGSAGAPYISQPAATWANYDMRDPAVIDREIKNTMCAGIDILYAENHNEGFDRNFAKGGYVTYGIADTSSVTFKTFLRGIKSLRDQGYATPKMAEWVDFGGFQGPYWGLYNTQKAQNYHLDLSTTAGRDYFYYTFIYGFWSNYFATLGTQAVSELALYNGKVLISLDHFYASKTESGYPPGSIIGINDDFFADLSTRFFADFGYKIYLTCNSYDFYNQTSTGDPEPANWVPNFNKVNEPDFFFGPGSNSAGTHGARYGLDSQGGYVLDIVPGFNNLNGFTLRNDPSGTMSTMAVGVDRATKWRADANHPAHHLGLTSWNFFPEGSQFTESVNEPDNGSHQVNSNWVPAGQSLDYSHARDYIKQTADLAAIWNDRVRDNADILAVNVPATMQVNHTYVATVTVRNSGNALWSGSGGYQLYRYNSGSFAEAHENPINDSADEIPIYKGIFHGRVKTFTMNVTPTATGTVTLQWQMIHQGVAFFGPKTATTTVTVQP